MAPFPFTGSCGSIVDTPLPGNCKDSGLSLPGGKRFFIAFVAGDSACLFVINTNIIICKDTYNAHINSTILWFYAVCHSTVD